MKADIEEKFAQAQSLIDRSTNIVLSTHDEPDIDGLGSMLALHLALKNLNKNSTVFSIKPAPDIFGFLPGQAEIKSEIEPEKIDLVIGLDYGGIKRLEILQAHPQITSDILTFDHHTVGEQAGLKIVGGFYSSTSEIIYQFLKFIKFNINNEIATCLLAGIFDDTGGFRHANTAADTLKIAGELLLKGAPLQKIVRASNPSNISTSAQTINSAWRQLQIDPETGLGFFIIQCENTADADNIQSINIANILSTAPEIKVAAVIVEKSPGMFECSLRSQLNRGIDVAQIAQTFGGGGHRLAAGFRSSATPETIIKQIQKLLLSNPNV